MNMIYVFGIMETLKEWSKKLEEWITENYTNPVLWVGILLIGVAFCRMIFIGSNKDN